MTATVRAFDPDDVPGGQVIRSINSPDGVRNSPDGVRNSPDPGSVDRLAEMIRPTALAADRTLPVHPALAPLFARGALQRGSVVRLCGPGATSLTLALVAQASSEGAWVGFVGTDDLGWSAAADLGVDLGRVLVVEQVPTGQWSTVTAALVDAVEVVVMAPDHLVRHGDARRLAARARERGSVLVVTRSAPWPIEPDITLHATEPRWEGVGRGHGRLVARSLTVSADGRRSAATERRASLWLPGGAGDLAVRHPVPDEIARRREAGAVPEVHGTALVS